MQGTVLFFLALCAHRGRLIGIKRLSIIGFIKKRIPQIVLGDGVFGCAS